MLRPGGALNTVGIMSVVKNALQPLHSQREVWGYLPVTKYTHPQLI